jgi:hypothetical protein
VHQFHGRPPPITLPIAKRVELRVVFLFGFWNKVGDWDGARCGQVGRRSCTYEFRCIDSVRKTATPSFIRNECE